LNTGGTLSDPLERGVGPEAVPLLARFALALVHLALVDGAVTIIIHQVAELHRRKDLTDAVAGPAGDTFGRPRPTASDPRSALRSVIASDRQGRAVAPFVYGAVAVVIDFVTDLEVGAHPAFTYAEGAALTDPLAFDAAPHAAGALGAVVARFGQ